MPKTKSRLSKDVGVSMDELCQQIGVSNYSIRRWRKEGLIPYYQIGGVVRYDLAKVKAALKRTERFEVPVTPAKS